MNVAVIYLLHHLSPSPSPFLPPPPLLAAYIYANQDPRLPRNIKIDTTLPASAVVSTAVESHSTFLDTAGRACVVIRARNLVDEFRDRDVLVSYEVPWRAMLRKPAVVFIGALAGYVVWSIVSRFEVRFSRKR